MCCPHTLKDRKRVQMRNLVFQFLRVCMRMPLYHIINLIKEKFLKSSSSSDPIIELRCNEFYLMNSQFEQLGSFQRPRKFFPLKNIFSWRDDLSLKR